MKLLLTNDDGIEAPGLAALVQAVQGLGCLRVVAPLEPQSGASHSMMDRAPLRVMVRHVPGVTDAHAVDGRPADCARLGLRHYVPDADWVLSGINAGGNLGVDAYYSGTVGAAREGAILGRPAIAVSQYIRDAGNLDWDRSARWAGHVIRHLLHLPIRPGLFWNVNLPQPLPGSGTPTIALVPLAVEPHNVDYHRDDPSREVSVFHYRGRYEDRPQPEGSDVHTVFSGHISITPVELDATQRSVLAAGLSLPPPPD